MVCVFHHWRIGCCLLWSCGFLRLNLRDGRCFFMSYFRSSANFLRSRCYFLRSSGSFLRGRCCFFRNSYSFLSGRCYFFRSSASFLRSRRSYFRSSYSFLSGSNYFLRSSYSFLSGWRRLFRGSGSFLRSRSCCFCCFGSRSSLKSGFQMVERGRVLCLCNYGFL